MFTSFTSRAGRLSAGVWLRRIAAALVVVTGGVLAWAAAVPAASAAIIPVPGNGPYGPVPATPAGPIRLITAGGMAGWQITLIAVAAALAAAITAVLLDRALATRRAMSALPR